MANQRWRVGCARAEGANPHRLTAALALDANCISPEQLQFIHLQITVACTDAPTVKILHIAGQTMEAYRSPTGSRAGGQTSPRVLTFFSDKLMMLLSSFVASSMIKRFGARFLSPSLLQVFTMKRKGSRATSATMSRRLCTGRGRHKSTRQPCYASLTKQSACHHHTDTTGFKSMPSGCSPKHEETGGTTDRLVDSHASNSSRTRQLERAQQSRSRHYSRVSSSRCRGGSHFDISQIINNREYSWLSVSRRCTADKSSLGKHS